MTSCSWARRARPSPERARDLRGLAPCAAWSFPTGSRRRRSPRESTSRSASGRTSRSRASGSPSSASGSGWASRSRTPSPSELVDGSPRARCSTSGRWSACR
eukprot:103228-Alexandrium_andersonii.AAC.1